MDDILTPHNLTNLLGESRTENIICLDTVPSTNDYLKNIASECVPGTVVVANGQTAGKGRLGRKFVSPLNEGVYLSYLLKPDCPIDKIPEITAWVAVAAARAISSLTDNDIGIKWVNDIVIKGKKVGGILSEMAVEGDKVRHVITGIGINVLQSEFPEELKDIAGSVYTQTGSIVSRCHVAVALIRELDRLSQHFPNNKADYLEYYREHCVTLGKAVVFSKNGEQITAFADGIDEDFSLIVRHGDGKKETLSSGEVSVRGFYGYV